jgi:hypothetical protein
MKRIFVALLTLLAALPLVGRAHFILLEPASWLVENERGDPQKLGPCGGTTADPGTPSNAIGKMRGGDTLHLKIKETIYHPGHYRVALALKSRDELPPDAPAVTKDTEKGPWSVSAPIEQSVKAPILADGLFVHTSRPTDPFETDVVLPNVNCEKCTLQITQFMAEHGYNKDGGYYYHHCADLQITANPTKPLDSAWMANR